MGVSSVTQEPVLVILAAGRASRFGSVKQLEPVGPASESLMDYTVFDALRAGFREVVFVIRAELEARFHASSGQRLAGRLPVTYVHQRLDDLPEDCAVPAGRIKPWGTAHAVLTLAPIVSAPFAVVNADDYYGPEAFQALGRFFKAADAARVACALPTFAMIGYRLGDTLSVNGSVSRGVCRRDDEGWLQQIDEILALEKRGDDGWYRDETGRERVISGDTLVSRNCWGFTPQVFPLLREGFRIFLAGLERTAEAEFLLPTFVSDLIQRDQARIKVLPGGRRTFGMTYRQDTGGVREQIASLISAEVYPEKLWP